MKKKYNLYLISDLAYFEGDYDKSMKLVSITDKNSLCKTIKKYIGRDAVRAFFEKDRTIINVNLRADVFILETNKEEFYELIEYFEDGLSAYAIFDIRNEIIFEKGQPNATPLTISEYMKKALNEVCKKEKYDYKFANIIIEPHIDIVYLSDFEIESLQHSSSVGPFCKKFLIVLNNANEGDAYFKTGWFNSTTLNKEFLKIHFRYETVETKKRIERKKLCLRKE